MTTTLPPSDNMVATPLDWGAATMDEVWVQSDKTGVSPCAILRALKQVGIRDAQLIN